MPRFLYIVWDYIGYSADYEMRPYIEGLAIGVSEYHTANSITKYGVNYTVDGNTITWYTTTSQAAQYNDKNLTYYWVAIG